MRSIRAIFRDHVLVDADGRHVIGTDRESSHWYGDAYEALFTDVEEGSLVPRKWSTRGDVRMMMEVGVADGQSLLAWAEVFPRAWIVGVDVHPPEVLNPNRSEFVRGDATTRRTCDEAVRGRAFDFIVDDASHQLPDVLTTLFWLWPAVRPGGLYVVEDLNSHLDRWRALFPQAEVVDTIGPSGGPEPLIVLRKET